ncbi:parB-like nuclease domain protein [Burkholderia pseudomallei MSHR5613]|uniref:plasmid partitioning protein RepB C-terminal domain-containing protein n=1 Tax=Burkholderia pseudomallei TaxID=28450 RepID=UPI0005316F48|nr:plasmid partitioning protein RepB C-terminal domain-containing protein [Burkholderia pseudomallei]KGS40361.1 parB-like nuclease domain protein [Burkholderia pseudomallei MSHR5613]
MDKRNRPVESGFNSEWFDVPLNVLHASKALPPRVKQSVKYAQIRSSVEVIGVVEPVVVIPHASVPGHFSILDGHLRVEVLNDLGRDRVRCLISKDDEALTYNKRVNRLAAIQEYNMIVRVYESGVTVERLAAALGLSAGTIRDRFRMLDGICDEAIKLLSDKRVPRRVFSILRQMKPFRQIDAAHAMINLDNYSGKFALAMLETTPEDQLADTVEKRQEKSGTIEAIQRLERELAVLQADTKLLEENYGPDSLKLVVIKTYVASLLDNARVVRWLAQFRSDYLQQLQLIAEVKTLAVGNSDR